MVYRLLFEGFLSLLAIGSIVSGVSGWFARRWWWGLYRRLTWKALTDPFESGPTQPPAWWEINALLGGLVQVGFGVILAGRMITVLLGWLF